MTRTRCVLALAIFVAMGAIGLHYALSGPATRDYLRTRAARILWGPDRIGSAINIARLYAWKAGIGSGPTLEAFEVLIILIEDTAEFESGGTMLDPLQIQRPKPLNLNSIARSRTPAAKLRNSEPRSPDGAAVAKDC